MRSILPFTALPGRPAGAYVRARICTAPNNWTLNLLRPAGPAVAAAATAASTPTLLAARALILAAWWWQRRRTRDARTAAARAAAQAELEQANRLTKLGQIAAGVTHDINQPVAAIAAWARNARTLLVRGSAADVEAALGTIDRLTERIGRIEAGLLREALAATDGRIALALERLGLPRKTFYDKLARHGIDPAAYRRSARRA